MKNFLFSYSINISHTTTTKFIHFHSKKKSNFIYIQTASSAADIVEIDSIYILLNIMYLPRVREEKKTFTNKKKIETKES